jgi:hypothetical protein
LFPSSSVQIYPLFSPLLFVFNYYVPFTITIGRNFP